MGTAVLGLQTELAAVRQECSEVQGCFGDAAILAMCNALRFVAQRCQQMDGSAQRWQTEYDCRMTALEKVVREELSRSHTDRVSTSELLASSPSPRRSVSPSQRSGRTNIPVVRFPCMFCLCCCHFHSSLNVCRAYEMNPQKYLA
jgi:hypothetical protein